MRRTGTALLLATLGPPAAAATGEHGRDLLMLREDARAAMKACGHCHDATQRSAIPAALRAFDLDQVEWATALDPSKLGCIEKRFDDLKVPEPDRTRVQRYLEAEWTRRATLPPEVRTGERAP